MKTLIAALTLANLVIAPALLASAHAAPHSARGRCRRTKRGRHLPRLSAQRVVPDRRLVMANTKEMRRADAAKK